MRPIRIDGAEAKPLGAPPDWKEDESGHCGALFIRREEIAGVAYMRSAWDVEHGEATLMFAGAKLTLGISGSCHPIVQLGIAELPPDFEPVMTARRFTSPDGIAWVRVEMLFAHAGGRKAFCEHPVEGKLADAVKSAIIKIERLAKREGWTE